MYFKKMAKSPKRLAMEIKGKDAGTAYQHLLRYGLSEAEATEVVTLLPGRKILDAPRNTIAEAIEDAVRAIWYDKQRIKEIFSNSWRYWLPPEERKET